LIFFQGKLRDRDRRRTFCSIEGTRIKLVLIIGRSELISNEKNSRVFRILVALGNNAIPCCYA
jgi:hypothetical protein